MIPPTFIEELLTRVDIADVVGRHVQLKKGGVNLMGLCPFHGEKSPSFSVSPSKQFYYCFGCGASGDAIRFLTEFTGISFIDAVNDLAQQVGLTVPDDDVTPAERERFAAQKQRKATLSEVLARAAAHYQRQLKGNARAVEYLKGRGLSGEIAAQFGLGYAPEGWHGLASAFADYDDPLLEESGMVIVKPADADPPAERGGAPSAGPPQADPHSPGGPADVLGGRGASARRYDRFRDRIMFPIRSVQGEVIGFGGRVLDRGEPKYLNSPETPVFSKGRELYGLYEARAALRERGHALVVEGYMDVVALAQSGFGNAVATLGTACTAEHVQKLFRYTDAIVFSFDGDAAGRRAAGRALEASLPQVSDTRSVRFLFLPPEHDPDSYVRAHGAAAFERCIKEAVALSRQILDVAGKDCELDTPEGRARLLAQAQPLWAALPDGALKRQMAGELAGLARVETGELLASWGAAPRRAAATPASAPPRPVVRRSARLSQGTATLLDRALWLLLHRCELWARLDGEAHDALAQQAPPYGALFAGIDKCMQEHGPLGQAALLADLHVSVEGEAAAVVLTRIAAFHDPDGAMDFQRELATVLERLRLHAVEEELKALFESGPLSPDAQQRGKQLMATQARIKAELARQAAAG